MIDQSVARALIDQGYETRSVEYKGSMNWDNAEIKVAKAILGFSNIADGGWLIIGIEKRGNNYEPTGVTDECEKWLNHDKISSHVATFADPYVDFEVEVIKHKEKKFGVIRVHEFPELPVICKRGSPKEGVVNGKIYTRSRRMIETTEVNNSYDFREIIELATRKQFLKALNITGRSISQEVFPTDQERYDKEAEDFL